MSERKTININPALFSVGGSNTTRKKRPASEIKDFKIKSMSKPSHSTKTLRNRLLHYIRKNQEDNFKKIHGKSEIMVPDKKIMHITDSFNNDFEESLKYMNDIADQVKHKVDNEYMMNQTLRNYKSLNPESILSGGDFEKAVEGLSTNLPIFTDLPPISHISDADSIKIKPGSQPQWGCMKGGSLPTYKIWKNNTQHNREPMSLNNSISRGSHIALPQINLGNMSMSSIGNRDSTTGSYGGGSHSMNPNTISSSPMSMRREPEIIKPYFDKSRLSQIRQTADKIKTANDTVSQNTVKYGKRKKTIRRTYKLGKSRITPKVSVLISNKTVRRNISTKTEKLKQIPIDEIRSVLIKKGFIKVGSLATNDVLRKMYESMLLVCGEVENHNPDNLLYNYFNSA